MRRRRPVWPWVLGVVTAVGLIILMVMDPVLEKKSAGHAITATTTASIDGFRVVNASVSNEQGTDWNGRNYQSTYVVATVQRDTSEWREPTMTARLASDSGEVLQCATPPGPIRWRQENPTKDYRMLCDAFVPFNELSRWTHADLTIE